MDLSRELGTLPVSIGTSLPLEALMALPNETFGRLLLNLKTLFRNLYQAYPTETRAYVTNDQLVDMLIEDIQGIFENLKNLTRAAVPEMVVYCPSYRSLAKDFPNAIIKHPETNLQKAYAAIEDYVVKAVIRRMGSVIIQTDVELPFSTKRTFILTHYPVDLLNKKGFGELVLLESHTGKLKQANEWYTKLQNGSKLTRIPFNALTLQILGDGPVHFKVMPYKFKKELFACAEQYKWTPTTTTERVLATIQLVKDPLTRQIFSGMLKGQKVL